MPLYLEDKKATLFKGEYKPVSLYLGDKKVTGYEYENAKGEHVSFENTYDDTASVVIGGKSEQVVTEQGKNLLPEGNLAIGVWNNDNLSPMNGVYRSLETDITLPAGTYVFSRPSGDLWIVRIKKDGITTIIGASTYSFTLDYPSKVNFSWRNGDNTEWLYGETTDSAEIQLELGSAVTAYEPFVPDSPSPDYPSLINSVEPFDLVGAGKNIADIKTLDSFKNGIFWYDGARTVSLTISGSTIHYDYDTSDLSNFIRAKITNLQANAQYTVSCKISPFTGVIRSLFGIINVSYNSLVNGVFKTTFTTDGNGEHLMGSGAGTDAMILHIQKTHTNQNINITSSVTISDIQIEFGNTATPYTPFKGLQNIHMPYTLRGLTNDVYDYIESGVLTRQTHFYDLKDVSGWRIYGDASIPADPTPEGKTAFYTWVFDSNRPFPMKHNRNYNLCGFAPFYTVDYIKPNTDVYFVVMGGSNGRARLVVADYITGVAAEDTNEQKIAKFKAWLDSLENTTILYELEAPITTPIDYEQIKTYYPYTQFYTTNSAVVPTLEVGVRVIDK